jgi:hypothetical protein
LARSVESEELHKLADRIEEVHPLLLHIENPVAAMPQSTETKYMATLR